MVKERLGLGTRAGEEQRGEQDVARRADWRQEATPTRGAGCSGLEQPPLRELPVMRKARRSPVSRYDCQERLIRDAMIYYDVQVDGRSQRFMARVWRLTPGRVSQIVKDMRQKAAEMPGGDAAIEELVLVVRDRSGRSQTEQTL
jgi:hypothetical protein